MVPSRTSDLVAVIVPVRFPLATGTAVPPAAVLVETVAVAPPAIMMVIVGFPVLHVDVRAAPSASNAIVFVDPAGTETIFESITAPPLVETSVDSIASGNSVRSGAAADPGCWCKYPSSSQPFDQALSAGL